MRIIHNNFLDKRWLSNVRSNILSLEGKLSRDGYNNQPTIRDRLDPRYAETLEVTDWMTTIWNKFLWGSCIEDAMLNSVDSVFYHAVQTKHGRTLLSSYGNNDGYGFHVDTNLDCIVTAVLMLDMGDTRFTGGDFVLVNEIIPFENNKLILFPSCRLHKVTSVSLDNDIYINRRFTLQYFISSTTKKGRFPDESSSK